MPISHRPIVFSTTPSRHLKSSCSPKRAVESLVKGLTSGYRRMKLTRDTSVLIERSHRVTVQLAQTEFSAVPQPASQPQQYLQLRHRELARDSHTSIRLARLHGKQPTWPCQEDSGSGCSFGSVEN